MNYTFILNGEGNWDGSLPELCPMGIERTSRPTGEPWEDIYTSLAEAKREAIKRLNSYLKAMGLLYPIRSWCGSSSRGYSMPQRLRDIRNEIRVLTVATLKEAEEDAPEDDNKFADADTMVEEAS